jgi:hypothetical protein
MAADSGCVNLNDRLEVVLVHHAHQDVVGF